MKTWIRHGTALLLALVLLLPAAQAAGSPFQDVSPDSYYYQQVLEMYESGVVNGTGNGRFSPTSSVTRAQALTMLCRLAQVDTDSFASSDDWYSGAENWAILAGVLPVGTDLTLPATREELAQYIVGVYQLPLSANTKGFSDTDSPYANTLKDYGISVGIASSGSGLQFGGDQNVRRCDLCIMLSRLQAAAQTPDWSSLTPVPATISGAFSYPDTLIQNPSTDEDYRTDLRYLMKHGVTEFVVTFRNLSLDQDGIDKLGETVAEHFKYGYNLASEDAPQYSAFYKGYTITSWGESDGKVCTSLSFKITLTLKPNLTAQTVSQHIAAFDLSCRQIVSQLYASGQLTQTMTDKEKALVLFQYVDNRLTYNLAYAGATPNTVLEKNAAVCEGYVALYTNLCHMAGVQTRAMFGVSGSSGHVWNVVQENGSDYYIDVTWGDGETYVDTDYFWISQGQMKQLDTSRTSTPLLSAAPLT